MREMQAVYPDMQDLVNSTAAARINGYLEGYGTNGALKKEIGDLGLSPALSRRLHDIVSASGDSHRGCPL